MAAKGGGRINFTKLGMAVIDELSGILRDLLSDEVKPTMIAKVVKNSTSLPRLRPEQEILVKKANTAGYTDFDTTLLYTLLRNECPNIPPPTNGWGHDPGPTDTTVGDDIERIRLIRNKVLGHIPTTSVTDAEFQSLWTQMELICKRMESHLGSHTNYVQHLQQIEMQSVDEQLENMYIEKLQIMLQNEKELKENLQEMKEEMQQSKKEMIKMHQEMKDMITETKETLSSKVDDFRSDVEQLKERDKYKAVTKVTMEVVPEKKAKQEDVDSLLQIEYELLLDIVQSIQEDSSAEYVFQRWKEIEKHGYKIEDKEEFPAFFEIIYKFKVKISRFAEMEDVIGFSIFSQFLNFVRIMRKKKGKLEVEHSSLILHMVFQSEEDLKSYKKDVQNGTIESHLSECLLFQPLLSIFDLNATDVIMKVTDITEAELTLQDMVMAQNIIICDICGISPVQMHCNSCLANLCNRCVTNHILDKQEKSHQVVVFKRKSIKLNFPVCKLHTEQKCKMKCLQCDTLLCIECLSSDSHVNHEFQNLLFLFNSHKHTIKLKTTELETSTYPKYEAVISELQIQLQTLPQMYDRMTTEISTQGEEWHKEVDIIINRQKQEVEKMKTDDLATLQKLLEEMKNLLSTLRQAIIENNDILQSTDVAEVLDSKNTSSEMWKPPPSVDITPATFKPLPIQGEQLHQMFGSLTSAILPQIPSSPRLEAYKSGTAVKQLQLLDSPEYPFRLHTGYNTQKSITCLGPDLFCVCGSGSMIKHFDLT